MKYLSHQTPVEELQKFLSSLGWLQNEKILKTTIPGEGNMNVVLHVTTDKRSFILKQSRPYVNKYQQLAAPLERIETEYQFYAATNGTDLTDNMPEMIVYSKEHFLMMLSYVDEFEDMTRLYADRSVKVDEVASLAQILNEIHQAPVPGNYPENKELRQLNHQHIFVLPFEEENGFELDDIQPGLQALSGQYKQDSTLKNKVDQLGDKYLSAGDTLLHGDYYPGSWMRARDQFYVIDTEFSFVGFREFDIGVMMAHLILITSDKSITGNVLENTKGSFDEALVFQMAGVEIMRRLIGLAQLPLERTLEEKQQLLQVGYQLIMSS
ncbi:MAG: phosphotransferase [Bacteroidota bacterium]